MKDEIKEILQKFNEEVENVELIRNPYSSEDKKFKKILIYLEEEHCDIFKKALDYITNLQEENQRLKEIVENLTTMTASGDRKQIKNTAQYKLEIAQDKIDKATKELEKLLPLCIMPNNTLIHATEKAKVIEKAINILQGKSDE